MSDDPDNIINWKFSELSEGYCALLKVFSIIGLKFSLEEAEACIFGAQNRGSSSKASNITFIQQQIFLHDRHNWIAASQDTLSSNPSYPFKYLFCFRERMVFDFISSRNQSDLKPQQHQNLIRLYEERMSNLSEIWYVPRICYIFFTANHVWGHANVLKQLKYMAMLALFKLLISEEYSECRDLCRHMISIVKSREMEADVGAGLLSGWSCMIAGTLLIEQDYVKSRQYIDYGLQLLNCKYPQTKEEQRKYLYYQGGKFMFYYITGIQPALNFWFLPNWTINWAEDSRNLVLDCINYREPLLDLMTRYLSSSKAGNEEQMMFDYMFANDQLLMKADRNYIKSRILARMLMKMKFSGYSYLAKCLEKSFVSDISVEFRPKTLYSVASYFVAIGKWKDGMKWAKSGHEKSVKYGK